MRNRLRELRERRGWSQAELAERIGVSRQSANAIEMGRSEPGLGLALRIGRAFGLPVESIFSND